MINKRINQTQWKWKTIAAGFCFALTTVIGAQAMAESSATPTSEKQLLNFHQSTALIGTSGQPGADDFELIAKAGYTTVINLAMHDHKEAVADEAIRVASNGMSYIHMPIPFDAPTADHLKRFAGILDVLEGEKVWVHCAVNARVSAFMHQYLTLTKGLSSEEASSPLLLKWLPVMDDKWKGILALKREDID